MVVYVSYVLTGNRANIYLSLTRHTFTTVASEVFDSFDILYGKESSSGSDFVVFLLYFLLQGKAMKIQINKLPCKLIKINVNKVLRMKS